jgi:hypothetical protein
MIDRICWRLYYRLADGTELSNDAQGSGWAVFLSHRMDTLRRDGATLQRLVWLDFYEQEHVVMDETDLDNLITHERDMAESQRRARRVLGVET